MKYNFQNIRYANLYISFFVYFEKHFLSRIVTVHSLKPLPKRYDISWVYPGLFIPFPHNRSQHIEGLHRFLIAVSDRHGTADASVTERTRMEYRSVPVNLLSYISTTKNTKCA
jgi:hypothetical protein